MYRWETTEAGSARFLPAPGVVYDDVLTPADRLERLRGAVQILMSLTCSPQERLDRALSLFKRAFRGEPAPGPVHDCYRRIYRAVGDPPYGTPFGANLEALSAAERDALVAALLELFVHVVRETPVDVAAASSDATPDRDGGVPTSFSAGGR